MRNVLTYGDISSSDYDIFIGQETIYNVPERAVEVVSVPGRNGALTIDQGHYENVSIEYYCFVEGQTEEEMHAKYNAYKNAIASVVGYQKIVDSYYPNEYRLGLFIEGIEADSVALGTGLEFRLIFNCKPQRYLTSGDNEITVTNGMVLNNPTLYDSEPLLMVEGYGDIEFNGYKISLTNETVGMVYPFTATANNKRGYYSMAFDVKLNYPFAYGDEIKFSTVLKGDFGHVFTNASSTARTGRLIFVPDSMYDSYLTRDGTFEAYVDSCTFTYGVQTIAHIIIDTALTDEDENTGTCQWYVQFTFDGASNINVIFTCTNTTSGSYADSFNPYYKTIELQPYICESNGSLLGSPTYIDCEIGEAYKYEDDVLYSLNSYIDLGSDLPKLAKGNNTFEIDGTITSLKVVPKWWQL